MIKGVKTAIQGEMRRVSKTGAKVAEDGGYGIAVASETQPDNRLLR